MLPEVLLIPIPQSVFINVSPFVLYSFSMEVNCLLPRGMSLLNNNVLVKSWYIDQEVNPGFFRLIRLDIQQITVWKCAKASIPWVAVMSCYRQWNKFNFACYEDRYSTIPISALRSSLMNAVIFWAFIPHRINIIVYSSLF